MCNPRYSRGRGTGNCSSCFNHIETDMVKLAHEKITSEASGIMESSWKIWFGKKIMGTRYIENIASDKVAAAKREAEKIIPGVVCRTIKQLLSIFFIVTIFSGCSYLILFYTVEGVSSGEELSTYRIMLTIIGTIFYIILLYKALCSGMESISKKIEDDIKRAAS